MVTSYIQFVPVQGVFRSIDLSPASVHDINYLQDVKHQFADCTINCDRGYLSKDYQLDLFTENRIELQVPMRKNQKNYKPEPYLFKKNRKRIETKFSKLCDQLMIRGNYAKTFEGLKTRILSKITSLTIIKLINKQLGRNINNIKVVIS